MIEIRLNDDGTLDEVVGSGDVHLEDMGHGWFLSIGDVAIWLDAKTQRVRANYEHRGKDLQVTNNVMPRIGKLRCLCRECTTHDAVAHYSEKAKST